MAIQDGFGDHLSSEEMAEFIEANEPLLRLKAGERLRGNPASADIWDDVLQEGRIVQFEVLSKNPDAPRAYVSAAMSNRVNSLLGRGQKWTGMDTVHGQPVDPMRRPGERDSIDAPDWEDVASADDVIGEVLMAYHHGEIHQAIAALTFTQRVHVFARFFYGMTNAEIAAIQQCSKQTVERQWRTEIRPQLVEELAHLA